MDKPLTDKQAAAQPTPIPNRQPQPGIICRGKDGSEHVATFQNIINNLKQINSNLTEENAILKALLKEKGVEL